MENKNRSILGNLLLGLICVMMMVEASFAYTATTATGILKEATTNELTGELAFVIIVIGIVLAGITLVTTKNPVISLIVGVGTIIVGMATDIATGIQAQF